VCADGSRPGRGLLEQVLERTRAEVLLAAPTLRRAKLLAGGLAPERVSRVKPLGLGFEDAAAVRAAAEQVQLVVAALEPFGPLPLALVRAALEAGNDWVDLTACRETANRVRALALELHPSGMGPAVATAFSFTALAGGLAALAAGGLDGADVLRVAFVPGPGFPSSRRELRGLLSTARRPFRLARQGLWCTVEPWSEPAAFHFPTPLGERTGRLADAPALEFLPNLLGAQRVEWRVDEQSLAAARWPAGLRWLARPLSGNGSTPPAAALGVEVEGRYGRHALRVRCSLADERGLERLSLLPAAHVIVRLLARPGELRGLVPHDSWTDRSGFTAECARLGLELTVDER
jgi:hypothetical protein